MKRTKCYKNVIKMSFCFRVLYFIVFAHIASTDLILKIDLRETTDRRSTANNIYITFVNTTDSEHMLTDKNITLNINEDKLNLNGFHQLVKRKPENNSMYFSFNVDTFEHIIPSQSYINKPFVQWKGDFSKIKEDLSEFKMNKKRTYVSTPHYNFAFKKNKKFDTGFENDDFRRKYIPKTTSQLSRENEIFDIISKQNKLIERIVKKVLDTRERKKKIVRSVFDDIIESVEARQNKIKTTSNVTTTTTQTEKLSTILTIVDETEIRNALKKDPFVNRILGMAAKKRQEYEAKKRTEQDFIT